jgi:uncharacterized membrane protein HdeD (DUF308 family)
MFPMIRVVHENLKELRDNWLWFVILGALLTVVGVVFLTYSGAVGASLGTALVFGFLLLIAGVFHVVGAFFTRSWGGFFLSLLAGILNLAAGLIMVVHPIDALIVFTLLIAMFFFVQGLFRVIAALLGQFRNWGYVLLSGAIDLLLGFLIWEQWPSNSLWIVGAFLGIDLIVNGVNYIIVGLRVRKLPV